MNGVGKAGSILIIIASAFMFIYSCWLLMIGGLTGPIGGKIFTVLALVILLVTIVNIVFAAINLSGKKNFIIISGIIALASILVVWIGGLWSILPIILFLIGGILVFLVKRKKRLLKVKKLLPM